MPPPYQATSSVSIAHGGSIALGQPPQPRVAGAEPVIRRFPPVPPSAMPPQSARLPPVQEAILDLTERIDDDEPATEDEPPPNQAPAMGRLNRPPPLKGAAPSLEPLMGNSPKRADAGLAASVAALTQIAGISQSTRQPELPLGEVGRTLEEMVRELLRPHMKEWLDAHLPRLVERMVRDEINRLVREVQER
jgi:hypothetical protein